MGNTGWRGGKGRRVVRVKKKGWAMCLLFDIGRVHDAFGGKGGLNHNKWIQVMF